MNSEIDGMMRKASDLMDTEWSRLSRLWKFTAYGDDGKYLEVYPSDFDEWRADVTRGSDTLRSGTGDTPIEAVADAGLIEQ